MKLFFAIAALAVSLAMPAMASVRYDEATHSLTINGMTTPYQTILVRKMFRAHEVDTVYMYGPGGHFYEGLKIGRMIAMEGARVIIPRDKACISACALSAMASDNVMIDGKMMLHRVFRFGGPSMETIEDIAAQFGSAYLDMAEYLLEFGYPVSVAKQILQNSSPCKFMVVIDETELATAKKTGAFVGYKTDDLCGG